MENFNHSQKLLLKIMKWSGVFTLLSLVLFLLSEATGVKPKGGGDILVLPSMLGFVVLSISFLAFIIILIGIAIKEGKN